MMDETSNNELRKTTKKKRSCYQCGQLDHRARNCPNTTANASCKERKSPAPDLGKFSASAPSSTFTYIELFAGIGGFRVALDRLGGRCVFASEVDTFCIKNYQANFSDRPAGDICRIPSTQIPDHDILVGGFPCQPFSSSGSKEGMNDTKGVLFREISRILVDKQPKAFLLENVRGLLLHEDGNTFSIIRNELEDCGYAIYYELVDSVNLLPQERKRLYIVGIRNDLVSDQYAFPKLTNLGRGVKDIIQQQSKEDIISEEEIESLTLTSHQLCKVQSQTYTQKHPTSRFLCNLTQPSKTLQSSYSKYMVNSQFIPVLPDSTILFGSNSLKVSHDNEQIKWRRFSHREAARLQGFPETFYLCSQRAYHMIGNAVSPPVIAMLAAPLVQTLKLATNNDDKLWGWRVARDLLIESSPNDYRRIELRSKLGQGVLLMQESLVI